MELHLSCTHYMKVTTYAPPFRPPFFRSLENLYSFDPYILAKMRKMSYFDPYFSSKLGKMYSFDPPFLTLIAFRVDGWCWASLSETWPSTPPPPPGYCYTVNCHKKYPKLLRTQNLSPGQLLLNSNPAFVCCSAYVAICNTYATLCYIEVCFSQPNWIV